MNRICRAWGDYLLVSSVLILSDIHPIFLRDPVKLFDDADPNPELWTQTEYRYQKKLLMIYHANFPSLPFWVIYFGVKCP